MNKANEIKSLVEELNKASYIYYNGTQEPIMSDLEFDLKLRKLQILEDITGLVLSNSPTHAVGSESVSSLPKVEHKRPMLSLDKCHSTEEVDRFKKDKEVVASVKLDGISTRAVYENGKLVSLSTRGNGDIGNLIFIHRSSYDNLPLEIAKEGTYTVDGETIIAWNDFRAINGKLSEGFSHPRNLVAGTLMMKDGSLSKGRHLRFVAWDVTGGCSESSYTAKMNGCSALGFETVPMFPYTDDSILNRVMNAASKKQYPCDGVVLKYDDTVYGDSLGRTDKFFRNGIAWKPPMESYSTVLRAIEWNTSRTGRINPVAVFDEIDLGGALTTRATLNNVSFIRDMEIGIGDELEIIRSNFVIPKIIDNLTRSNSYVFPDKCPDCGGEAVLKNENGSAFLFCTNENCKGKLLSKLELFVSKEGMDIKGLGEKQLAAFMSKGWLNSVSDIFLLEEHKSEMENLDGFGKSSADNIISSVVKAKTFTLARLLRSIAIPLLGKRKVADLYSLCGGDIAEFERLLSERADFAKLIDGFGEEINGSIYKWFDNPDNKKEFDRLIELGNLVCEKKEAKGSSLAGKTFVITGKLEHFANRDALVSAIEENGGKVSGSVSAKTDYLINNDVESTSGKNKKAKELNIPIISENDFLSMV